MAATRKATGGERFESFVLVLILLIVGGFDGFAAFSHVHDWTMTNSPDGTSDWFGWANAATTELVPTAAALVIRRRHRNDQKIWFPMCLLFGFVGLSLIAQLSVAKPTIFGWMVSAIPAMAFVLLTKLILSSPKKKNTKSTANPTAAPAVPSTPAAPTVNAQTFAPAPITQPVAVPAPVVVPTPAAVAPRITGPRPTVQAAPAAVPATGTGPAHPRPSKATTSPAPALNPPTTDSLVTASGAVQPSLPILSPAKLARARELAAEYLTENGTQITAGQMAVRLKVTSDEAKQALAVLNLSDNQPVTATR